MPRRARRVWTAEPHGRRSVPLSCLRSFVRCGLPWLALLLPWPAHAWNSAGHRLVACIAWEQLADDEHAAIARLLHEHPDYARWTRRADDASDRERSAFIEASTWPDEIRKDKRFYDAANDPPTPTSPGFPDMERRRNWHIVNFPLRADGRGSYAATHGPALSGRLVQAFDEVMQTLGDGAAPPERRSYALPWLIHLVGDAHQPLHASVRIRADGTIEPHSPATIDPFSPGKRDTTLHAYWDDLPGPPWLRGEHLDAACRALASASQAPARSSPAQWIEESWQIARNDGYPPGNDEVPTISAQFNTRAHDIARRRISEAGHRLAGLLHELLGGAAR